MSDNSTRYNAHACDCTTIADALRDIARASAAIAHVMQNNPEMQNLVSKRWPIPTSADEFGAECNVESRYFASLALE